MIAIARLHLAHIAGGRRLLVILLLGLAVVVISGLIAFQGGGYDDETMRIPADGSIQRPASGLNPFSSFMGSDPQQDMVTVVGQTAEEQSITMVTTMGMYLAVLLGVMYATGVFTVEVEGRTISYTLLRARPRWQIYLSKFLATWLVIAGVVVATALINTLLLSPGSAPVTYAAVAVYALLSSFVYTGIFSMIGVIAPRIALIAGIMFAAVYTFLYEGYLPPISGLARAYSLTDYFNGALVGIGEIAVGHEPILAPRADLTWGIGVPVVVGAIAISIGCWFVGRMEYLPKNDG